MVVEAEDVEAGVVKAEVVEARGRGLLKRLGLGVRLRLK